jgi:hypothetical protein
LSAFSAGFRSPVWVVGKVAAAAALSALPAVVVVFSALLIRVAAATLLATLHAIVFATLPGPLLLVATSTLVWHSCSP